MLGQARAGGNACGFPARLSMAGVSQSRFFHGLQPPNSASRPAAKRPHSSCPETWARALDQSHAVATGLLE